MMKEDKIIAFLNNESSGEEKAELQKWIQHSQENRLVFERVKMIWDNSQVDFTSVELDTGKAWDQIQRNIAEDGSISKEASVPQELSLPGTRSRRSPASMLRIAASIVVLLGLGYLSARLINNRVLEGQEWIRISATADRSDIELPDGSHVWLNKNSTLSYPERFRPGRREVRISGEAFFDVAKDRRKPFIVSTERALVEVLGTSFNVESAEVKDAVSVTVVSGKVALSEKENPENALLLVPGERGILHASGNRLEKGLNSDHNFLAWKTGILTFKSMEMYEVCTVLSDHFGISFLTDPRTEWDNMRLSATYDNKSLEEVLKILTLTLNISYELTNETITLQIPFQ